MSECLCEKVSPIGNGIWQCVLGNCRRLFIPIDACELCPKAQAEEQLEVES